VKYNFETQEYNEVWFVNPATTANSNYIYGGVKFNFSILNLSSVLSNPSNWAKQVGGKSDSIIGITIFADSTNNNYIKQSDVFSLSISPPTWTSGAVEGLSLKTIYDTNMMSVKQQPIEG
jgi:hypothetical protein